METQQTPTTFEAWLAEDPLLRSDNPALRSAWNREHSQAQGTVQVPQSSPVYYHPDPSNPLSRDVGYHPARPDYGLLHSINAAYVSGSSHSVEGQAFRAANIWMVKSQAIRSAENLDPSISNPNFIDQSEVLARFGDAVKFEDDYEGKMSAAHAEVLYDYHIQDSIEEARTALSSHPVGSLVGGLAGGVRLLDTALFYFLPQSKLAKFGMGETAALRASKTGIGQVVSHTINGAINGEAAALASLPVMASLAEYNQTPFDTAQVIDLLQMGPLIGGLGGLVHGSIRRARGSDIDRIMANAVMNGDHDLLTTLISQHPDISLAADAHVRARDRFLNQTRESQTSRRAVEQRTMEQTRVSDTPDATNLGDLVGQDVSYAGYKGKLIRTADGDFAVLRDVVKKGEAHEIIIDGSGKDPAAKATELGVRHKGSPPSSDIHFMADAPPSEMPQYHFWDFAGRRAEKRRQQIRDQQWSEMVAKDPSLTEADRAAFMEKARREGSPIDSTSHAPGRSPEVTGPSFKIRVTRLIDEVLAVREGTASWIRPADRETGRTTSIHKGQTPDELFLRDVWRRLFGVDLSFIDPKFASELGMRGFLRASDPAKAYVKSGELNFHSTDAMLFLAGHELGHSIRLRDPAMWRTMVQAMMESSKDSKGPLAQAWRDTIEAHRGSLAWLDLDMSGKMDEAFASVLGQAMQTKDFWHTLARINPDASGKFVSHISGLGDKLAYFAHWNKTPVIQALHQGLGAALYHSGDPDRLRSTKVRVDFRELSDVYHPWKDGIAQFQERMAMELNRGGLQLEKELAAFMEWENQLFPQVAELNDRSGSFDAIRRGVKIDAHNPAIWVLHALFQQQPRGTLERAMFDKMKRGMDGFKWMYDRNGNPKFGKGDTRTPSGSKDYYSSMLREYMTAKDGKGRNLSPMMSFKNNHDGTWDIGFHTNDDFPRWHEVFDHLRSNDEITARVFVEEKLFNTRQAFADLLNHLDENKPKKKEIQDTLQAHRGEFGDYLNSLDLKEIRQMAKKDPDALWQGYALYLEGLVNEGGKRDSLNRYQEFRNLVDPLLKFYEKGSETTMLNEQQKALTKAWDDFRKWNNDPEATKFINDPDHSVPQAIFEPSGYMAHERIRIVQDIRDQFAETKRAFDNMIRMSKGEPMVFGLDKNADVALMAELAIRGKDQTKWEARNARLEEAIQSEANRRMTEIYPNWRLDPEIQEIAKIADSESISLKDADQDRVSNDYRNHPEFDHWLENPVLSVEFSANDILAMAEKAPTAQQISANHHLTAKQAADLAFDRLKRDHAFFSPHLLNPESTRAALFKESLSRVGLDDFSLDPKKKPAEGAVPPPPSPLTMKLDEIKSRLKWQQDEAERAFNGKESSGTYGNEVVHNQFEWFLRDGLDPAEALVATQDFFRVEAESAVVAAINNHQSLNGMRNVAKRGLNTLFSWLDSSPRELYDRSIFDFGTKKKKQLVRAPGDSVGERMLSRVESDQAPLIQVLIDTGFYEMWRANNPELMKRFITDIRSGKSKDPKLQRVIDVVNMIHETQAGRLNMYGANIRTLKGFFGSQVHNPHAIRDVDIATYTKDVMPWVDWVATEKNVGKNTLDSAGKPVFSPQVYLEQFYHEATNLDANKLANFDPNTMAGNIANQVSRSRTLIFKDSFAFDYDVRYGSGRLSNSIVAQMTRRAELATVMEHFGTDYKTNRNTFFAELGHAGNWRADKLGRIQWTFDRLTGDLNHPEDIRLAAKGKVIRQFENINCLALSGISSLTDIPMAVSTLRWAGVSPKDLHARVLSSMVDYAKADPKNRLYLMGAGAGIESLLRGISQTEAMRGPVYELARKGSDKIFELNGQEGLTNALQYAFHDIFTQHLGEMSRLKNIPPEFRNWLQNYGIQDAQWHAIREHSATIEGLPGRRLSADMVLDAHNADLLRTAISDTVHQAILQPSVSDRAALTMGLKDGTYLGTAVRILTEYKGYPLAMITRTQRRFANAYGNESMSLLGLPINRGRMEQLALASAMFVMAGTVLAIKDVLRGREPFNPFDSDQWRLGNAVRIVGQMGMGPTAIMEQAGSQALGPAFGAAYDIGHGLATGNGYQTTNAVLGQIPVLSAAPIREAGKAFIGGFVSDSYGVQAQMQWHRLYLEKGQKSVYAK